MFHPFVDIVSTETFFYVHIIISILISDVLDLSAMWQYTAGWPYYLNILNHSWPLDRLLVSLISGQGYLTFLYRHSKQNIYNQAGGRKEKKQTRAWVSSRRKKGEGSDTFLSSVSYRDRVFERNSLKVPRNADVDCSIRSTALFCWLLGSISFSWLLRSVLSSSVDWRALLFLLTASSSVLWDLPSLILF